MKTDIPNQVTSRKVNVVCDGFEPVHTSNQSSQSVEALFDRVFKQLGDIRPGWRAAFKDSDSIRRTKLQWIKAFIENNITNIDQMHKAFVHARRDAGEYFPSVGKFILWCHGESKEAYEQAWNEAVGHCHEVEQHVWSILLIRKAGAQTGWRDIHSATGAASDRVRSRFINHYKALLANPNGLLLEDKQSGKTAAQMADEASTDQLKKQIKKDGCSQACGMADVMAMMGE